MNYNQDETNFFFLDKKELSKNNNNYGRCYTCKPRGKVKKHIISVSECGKYTFHHDMTHRPIIIVTPNEHYHTIYEFNEIDLHQMYNSINKFCKFWNITDYQVLFNNGTWQTHNHFHIKLKINEKIINRMRGDHFKKLKLEESYKTQ